MTKDDLLKLQEGLRELRGYTLHIRNVFDLGIHDTSADGVDKTDVVDKLINIVNAALSMDSDKDNAT